MAGDEPILLRFPGGREEKFPPDLPAGRWLDFVRRHGDHFATGVFPHKVALEFYETLIGHEALYGEPLETVRRWWFLLRRQPRRFGGLVERISIRELAWGAWELYREYMGVEGDLPDGEKEGSSEDPR